ncbi:VeA protein [Metarhizium rileyi]|uniref:VeA protein n=1 Tax=Metarhizium rileyi (strain RCEF 4871) TaxID=1649241 RepID=A0A167CNH5_METRR|nr:VeA protein [Metarhizium rileyi RCEF 4871]TWU74142.1 velvet protein [Metarhizium rileyi]
MTTPPDDRSKNSPRLYTQFSNMSLILNQLPGSTPVFLTLTDNREASLTVLPSRLVRLRDGCDTMAASSVQIPINPSRDSVHRIHRITRENRSLWYQLTVLQQPERARACGSGMKANSDRRPVDPPPVVELRIIEGPSVEEGKDVTFDYNANFFLYASLEQARTMAHGRVQNSAATNPPILTGVPASGMAYLDRPAEAGYFIFPDLSVRHEGYFRLSFSLFETTKEEKDFDMEPASSDLPPGVDWRMEIKTNPFNVFSAKKFPGLMESTQLSKTVADQGCRVRIRRDVRMRKRDGKPSAFERREEDFRRRTVTPAPEDPHGIRSRSLSNSSEHRVPYAHEPHRRPSAVDAYHTHPPPPCYDPVPPPSRNCLSFGEHPGAQYTAPRHYAVPSQTNGHHMPTTPYPPPSHSASYVKPEQNSYTIPHHARNPSSTCPSPIPSVKQEASYDRTTGHYISPSPSRYSETSRQESNHSYPLTPLLPQPPRRTSQSSLAPLKIAALVSPSPLPPIEAQTEPVSESPLLPTGGKRKLDDVFIQGLHPLQNGQRQHDPHFARFRGPSPEPYQGMYSRADGKVDVVEFNRYQ